MRLLSNVPIIQPLIDFFEGILKFFHDTVGLGWGFSIIALTILVRACLLPLTFKQFHSMQRMAHLQPEMKKLQEKFKGDKERMNQEMMKFYRENKVNPFASCLPMVAQFPVFISLYYMLRTDLRRDICPQINGEGTVNFANPIPCSPLMEPSSATAHLLSLSQATGVLFDQLPVVADAHERHAAAMAADYLFPDQQARHAAATTGNEECIGHCGCQDRGLC